MSSDLGDVTDAARLVSFAAERTSPAHSQVLKDLVRRYHQDQEFADMADAVAAGLGLNITVNDDVGVVGHAFSDGHSPFRRRAPGTTRRTEAKAEENTLIGLAVLGICRTAFPKPAHLANAARIADTLTIDGVVDYLDRVAGEIAAAAADDVAGNPDPELWRPWSTLIEARSQARRSSAGDRRGIVTKAFQFLADQGLVRDRGAGVWAATPRFRIAVRSMVSDSATMAELRGVLAAARLPADGIDDLDELHARGPRR